MPYIYIVLAIIVLFVVMHKFTELEMQQKVVITIVMALLIIAFYFFEQANTKTARKIQGLRYAFEHGKTLICKDKEVTKKLYNYASRSFIGKKDTKVFRSPNIAIGDCKIKP
jgi:hypothetical protein